jgi:hypothetical protein
VIIVFDDSLQLSNEGYCCAGGSFSPEFLVAKIVPVCNCTNTKSILVAVGGLVVACLPLDPKFASSNTAEDSGIFKGGKKVRRTTSFVGEVKPSVPCRRFTACLRILRVWKRYLIGNIQHFLSRVPPASLLDDWVEFPESSGGRMMIFPLPILFHRVSSDSSPGGWTIGRLVTAIHRCSLTPSTLRR